MDEVEQTSVFFSGHVQGVGFRYTALQVSREFEVSGYVKNLPDGRVQLELEGHRDEVERYLSALSDRMHGYIRNTEKTSRRGLRHHFGFSIR